MPLKAMTAGVSIEPAGTGRSRVSWTVAYRVKFGPLGWLMGQTMMKLMMGKVLGENLDALAEAATPHPARTTQPA